MSPAGLGPENDCAGGGSSNCERQNQPLVGGCYVRTTDVSVQLENKIPGRESEGACR
jgi:hypothetical protein